MVRRIAFIGLATLTFTSAWASAAVAQTPVIAPPDADPRFVLAEHAIDRITATVLPRAGDAQPANDDRISQVVETVRAIVSDTVAADARSADAMQDVCATTLGITKPAEPPAITTAVGGDRRNELAYACTDYLLARIKLAKLAVQDQGQTRALRQLQRTLRPRRTR
jgi:hypothetical protein